MQGLRDQLRQEMSACSRRDLFRRHMHTYFTLQPDCCIVAQLRVLHHGDLHVTNTASSIEETCLVRMPNTSATSHPRQGLRTGTCNVEYFSFRRAAILDFISRCKLVDQCVSKPLPSHSHSWLTSPEMLTFTFQ